MGLSGKKQPGCVTMSKLYKGVTPVGAIKNHFKPQKKQALSTPSL
jgi:hypothetical protein